MWRSEQGQKRFLLTINNTSTDEKKMWRSEQGQIKGSFLRRFLLTLKMSAAEAVKMSVNTTNSLSQDYTSLDKQLHTQLFHIFSLLTNGHGMNFRLGSKHQVISIFLETSHLHVVGQFSLDVRDLDLAWWFWISFLELQWFHRTIPGIPVRNLNFKWDI